ncbi:MAG: OsmC family protein [Chitinophagaceae bacterium]|nr:OsmC family protein [Chitinophagaceae bacterium]
METRFVHSEFTGGMSFTADIYGHKILVDAKPDEGGEDRGPGPKTLMLASLAGCTGMDVVALLKKMRVEYSDFSIDVTALQTDEHPKIYAETRLVYSIRLKNKSDRPKMEKAVHLSQEKYCGVSEMFRRFSKLEFEVKYL